jgi:hypothetical protein
LGKTQKIEEVMVAILVVFSCTLLVFFCLIFLPVFAVPGLVVIDLYCYPFPGVAPVSLAVVFLTFVVPLFVVVDSDSVIFLAVER